MYASLHKKTTRINYIKSHLYYKHIMYAVLDLINVCEFLFLQKYGLYFTDIEPCFFYYYYFKCPYVYINKLHNLDFELEKS